MNQDNRKIIVYYDGACPKCVKDRCTFEKLAGKRGERICWTDITDQEDVLREIGIDPHKALTELHIQDENKRILTELDAYILLMGKVPLLKPLAWLIGLPFLRPLLSKIYHWQVAQRLTRSGRL